MSNEILFWNLKERFPRFFFILAQLIFEKSRKSHVYKSSEETNHQVFELHEFPLLHFQESVHEQSVECGF